MNFGVSEILVGLVLLLGNGCVGLLFHDVVQECVKAVYKMDESQLNGRTQSRPILRKIHVLVEVFVLEVCCSVFCPKDPWIVFVERDAI